MTSKKQNNPDIDFGFYATIPRMIRTLNKKELNPLQKWLYVCLKDLCGDTGTCYRTLRVLSEETGISTGMISESIPKLHDIGWIHAEKKRRGNKGKEVWHITIADIWMENGKLHPTKVCSQDEQTASQKNVQDTNVHHMNKTSLVCSPHEQTFELECSPHEQVSKNSKGKNITEVRTVVRTTSPRSTFENLSPESQNIWQHWSNQSRFQVVKPELTKTAVKRCEELAILYQTYHVNLDTPLMEAIHAWAKEHMKYLQNDDWELGNLCNALPKYLQAPTTAQDKPHVGFTDEEAQSILLEMQAISDNLQAEIYIYETGTSFVHSIKYQWDNDVWCVSRFEEWEQDKATIEASFLQSIES